MDIVSRLQYLHQEWHLAGFHDAAEEIASLRQEVERWVSIASGLYEDLNNHEIHHHLNRDDKVKTISQYLFEQEIQKHEHAKTH